MATPILMPKQGNSVEECLIVAWKKKVGETVTAGEPIAEMETDKATFEIEAPADGKIIALFVNEGELAPVLTNVGVIGADGEDVESFRPAKAAPAAAAAPAPGGAPAAAAPVAGGAATVEATATASAAPAAPQVMTGVASPRARLYAKSHGIDYSGMTGSGPNGRITEEDLKARYYSEPRKSFLARKLLTKGYEMGKVATGVDGLVRGADLKKGEPMSNVRKVIAQRMNASLKDHAQLTLNGSARADKLLACRGAIKKQQGEPGFVNVTVGDLIMFAVVAALKEFPALNCEYYNNKIYPGKGVNIAFACDTPKGLLVPVLHGAGKMELKDIALKVKQLAAEAIGGSISPDNLEGGTFTVSNLGAFGIESFTPVLNAPQVAILGVCAPVLRPVREGGEIKYCDYIGLSLTIDHQVVDGAPGAKFLQAVKANIEKIDELTGIAL